LTILRIYGWKNLSIPIVILGAVVIAACWGISIAHMVLISQWRVSVFSGNFENIYNIIVFSTAAIILYVGSFFLIFKLIALMKVKNDKQRKKSRRYLTLVISIIVFSLGTLMFLVLASSLTSKSFASNKLSVMVIWIMASAGFILMSLSSFFIFLNKKKKIKPRISKTKLVEEKTTSEFDNTSVKLDDLN